MTPANRQLEQVEAFLSDQPGLARGLLHQLQGEGRPFLLRNDLQDALRAMAGDPQLQDSPLVRMLATAAWRG